MKVIRNDAGRAHQTVVPDEIHPDGGYYLAEMIRLITDRYGFSEAPTVEDTQVKGAVFKDGRLVSGTRKISIVEFGFLGDGIYATASDTMSADFILDDMFTWAGQAIGLRAPITKLPRKYDNSAIVEFEADVSGRLDIFDGLIGLYNEMLANLYNEAVSVSFNQIGFAFDALEANLSLSTNFTIARRDGQLFSSNRYYCIAPLKTDMHIELLEKFESALI